MGWVQPGKAYNSLPDLPPREEVETKSVLKCAIEANRWLAEFKGTCQRLPNPELLINSVVLQESRDSSAIENIVTTQDALYRAIISPTEAVPFQTKEVLAYREAIYRGWETMKENGLLVGKTSMVIMQCIKKTTAGYRNVSGTQLTNPVTQKTIYTPPDWQQVPDKMAAWERFVNEPSSLDPLVRMAMMHYQFEAIHPFADGNGRTGRILNVLFLLNEKLITLPALYHSAYIIQHKSDYYRCLREVTEADRWEQWILFMLEAVKETARFTLTMIEEMLRLKEDTLKQIKTLSQKLPAFELNELIFSFPYIKIKVLEDRKLAKRQAASSYLQQLADRKILTPLKVGREIYYVNHALIDIITRKTELQ
jgi:Fic family protein